MEKKNNCTKQFTMRITSELSDRISERAIDAGLSDSAWVKSAIEFALENMNPHTSAELSREELVKLLTYDEGIADLIYQKVCEKLKMIDILSEIFYFATHCKAESVSELSEKLCTFAARMHFLISRPVDDDEIIHLKDNETDCSLSWKKRWTLEEFYKQSTNELKKYDFFYMECADPEHDIRNQGIFFWHRSENVSEKYPISFFEPTETVYVHGAVLINNNPDDALPRDIENRIVKMVRYVSRDSNLGDTGIMTDASLRSYHIQNEGYFPQGIPYDFRFGWESDDWNVGKYMSERDLLYAVSNNLDKTLRPVVQTRWHYTESDLLFRDNLGVIPPFNKNAVPLHLGYGYHIDAEEQKDGRWVKPVWIEYPDPTRNNPKERREYLQELYKNGKVIFEGEEEDRTK